MTDITFSELSCKHGSKIGVIELNKPKALNALSLNMIRLMHEKLIMWASDDNIRFIIMQGAGDKAFCAGGDVVSLYHAIKSSTEAKAVLNDYDIINNPSGEFFTLEYKLDLYIHEYTKPILAWGDGYVFGGGLGLFAGATHRITTEKTIMAMPETAIGLYPDVGASWFLNQMPNNLGLFLGITGAFFNTADAKYLGLSDFSIESSKNKTLINELCQVDWTVQNDISDKLDNILRDFESNSCSVMPVSKVQENESIITSLILHNNIDSIYNTIVNASFEDKWLRTAQQKLCSASVLSILITYKQLELSKNFSIAECFEAEKNLSYRCCQYTEFSEGVRAQLVDKDKNPQWAFNKLSDINPELIQWFFTKVTNT